jgi:chromosome segregation ATPase
MSPSADDELELRAAARKQQQRLLAELALKHDRQRQLAELTVKYDQLRAELDLACEQQQETEGRLHRSDEQLRQFAHDTQSFKQRASDLQAELGQSQQRLQEADNRLQRTGEQLHQAEERLRQIRSSASWKAAAPLREIERFIMRLRKQ